MVVDGDSEHTLRLLLTNDILIEDVINLFGDGQFGGFALASGLLDFLSDDVVAEIDTLVANKDGGPSNELSDLVLAFTAKGAIEQLTAVARTVVVCHLEPRLVLQLDRHNLDTFHQTLQVAKQLTTADDFVNQSILHTLFSTHEAIALSVTLYHLHGLSCVL